METKEQGHERSNQPQQQCFGDVGTRNLQANPQWWDSLTPEQQERELAHVVVRGES